MEANVVVCQQPECFIHGPPPEQGKPAIVYNLRKHSEGQGGLAEQHPSRNTDDEGNQANETKSTLGGQRHMFTHMRQVVPVDESEDLPPLRLDVLHSIVTALLPWQRGARVAYMSTYRRAERPLRWLR